MGRTFGALLFFGAPELELSARGAAAGQYAITRNALGDISWNNTAGVATVQFWGNLVDYKRPYIQFPAFPGQGTVPNANEFQEAFGTAAGGPANPFSGVAAGSTAAVNLPGTVVEGTAQVPWGVAVVDVFAVYSVQTAALTTATIGCNRLIYQENGAFTNTVVLAATGIATTTTTSASTPHVQKVAVAQPLVYEAADYADFNVELLITTAATSLVRVYGMGLHLAVEM